MSVAMISSTAFSAGKGGNTAPVQYGVADHSDNRHLTVGLSGCFRPIRALGGDRIAGLVAGHPAQRYLMRTLTALALACSGLGSLCAVLRRTSI